MNLGLGRIQRIVKKVGVLGAGVALAQLIAALASPILTRLFSAEEFGTAAVFGAIVSLFGIIATGRYHMATLLPEHSTDADGVLLLSLYVTVAVSIVIGAGCVIAQSVGPFHHILSPLGPWILLVPINIFGSAAFEALCARQLRAHRLGTMARAQVERGIASAASQIGLGVAGAGVWGLIVGATLGHLAGLWNLSGFRSREVRDLRFAASSRIRGLAARYSRFPKFDVPATIAGTASVTIAVFGITALYSAKEVGYYALATRLLAIPASVVAIGVGQIYMREASAMRSDPVRAKKAFDITVVALAVLSTAVFVPLWVTSGPLIDVVFGLSWHSSSAIVVALLPQYWVQFVASPVSSVLTVYERQPSLLVAQILSLVSTAVPLAIAGPLDLSLTSVLHLQAAMMCATYLAVIVWARHIVSSALTTKEGTQVAETAGDDRGGAS